MKTTMGTRAGGEPRFDAVAGSRQKYRPIARIGRGGMAEVLLAVLPGPGKVRKLLVLKRPLSFLTNDAHFNAMFLTEARIASRLNHPNVISTFEVGQSPEGPFIVMEYLEGQPLSNVFRRLGTLRMPLSYRLHVLRNLLAGLDYVHTLRDFDGRGLRLVHCDVSPQNVFIGYDGRVTLVDFGIAKAERIGRVSRPGVIEGKIGYMAPEQLAGRAVDQRADIFSFGVILWETLAGVRVTLGDDDVDVIRHRTHGEIPDLQEFAPETPPALIDLCARTLALHPGDRIQTASAVMEALDGFVDNSGVRINDREVGQYIGNAFSVEREARRRLIESQMLLVDEGVADLAALPDLLRPDAPATTGSDIADVGIDTSEESGTAAPSETTRVTVSLLPEEPTQVKGELTAAAGAAGRPRAGSPGARSLDGPVPSSLTEVVVMRNHSRTIALSITVLGLAVGTIFGLVNQQPPPATDQDKVQAPVVANPPATEPGAAPPQVAPPAAGAPAAAVIAPMPRTSRPSRPSPSVKDHPPAPTERRRFAARDDRAPRGLPAAPSPASATSATSAPAPSATSGVSPPLAEPRPHPKSSAPNRAAPAPGESLGSPTPRGRRPLDLDNPYGH